MHDCPGDCFHGAVTQQPHPQSARTRSSTITVTSHSYNNTETHAQTYAQK